MLRFALLILIVSLVASVLSFNNIGQSLEIVSWARLTFIITTFLFASIMCVDGNRRRKIKMLKKRRKILWTKNRLKQ